MNFFHTLKIFQKKVGILRDHTVTEICNATKALLEKIGEIEQLYSQLKFDDDWLVVTFNAPTLHKRCCARTGGLQINLDHLGIFDVRGNLERMGVFAFLLDQKQLKFLHRLNEHTGHKLPFMNLQWRR